MQKQKCGLQHSFHTPLEIPDFLYCFHATNRMLDESVGPGSWIGGKYSHCLQWHFIKFWSFFSIDKLCIYSENFFSYRSKFAYIYMNTEGLIVVLRSFSLSSPVKNTEAQQITLYKSPDKQLCATAFTFPSLCSFTLTNNNYVCKIVLTLIYGIGIQ